MIFLHLVRDDDHHPLALATSPCAEPLRRAFTPRPCGSAAARACTHKHRVLRGLRQEGQAGAGQTAHAEDAPAQGQRWDGRKELRDYDYAAARH
jgi:hypothetical protein